ncbi:MAG TPA: dockerin type I domain-containing protein, partial [Tepidisphaeraceae bacterium]|nr:dockerin type I domain-containing protein [Tepidisphaeraceae bacterium]
DDTGLATLGSTLGTYTVTAALGSASNTAQVTVAATPTVSSFQVNDGNAQRSMVDSLTVTFNESVTLADNAITLNMLSQTGGSPTPMTFSLNTPDGGTTWVLTFTDPSYIGSSLPDGAYDLNVSAGGVTATQGGLSMAADQDFQFIRLYGDFNGDGVVNSIDFGTIAPAFGHSTNSSDWYLDYDDNGVINSIDFGYFATNFGRSMSIPSMPSVTLLTAAAPPPATPPALTPTVTLAAVDPALPSTPALTPIVTSTSKKVKTTTAPEVVTPPAKPVSKQKPRYWHR